MNIFLKIRCPHCKAFTPLWDVVAKEMVKDNTVLVGKFNCEERLVSPSVSIISFSRFRHYSEVYEITQVMF